MSETNDDIVHSLELFNTEELMQSDEIISDKNTNEIVTNSEDYETQINDDELIKESEDHETQINEDIDETEEENFMETDETEKDKTENTNKNKVKTNTQDRLTNLPLAKVKHIIKLDPDVKLVNGEAVFLITKTTEMFIKTLAKEAFGYAAQNKKKTIAKSHVDQALAMLPVEL
ncbi:DNA polymerase epsilon subunit 4 [Chironomus tepperi]|uniref:DNA polymerase epsilon subunit 4 n=1 Tax=Chironomus tepperi TaxID=113505 RepID=UPI00391F16A5